MARLFNTWLANKSLAIREKLNIGQSQLVDFEGTSSNTSARTYSNREAYDTFEVVRRGVDLLVDSCAGIGIDVKDKLQGVGIVETALRPAKISKILNYQPNQFMPNDSFKRLIFLDLILEGNAFIYFDGAYMYVIPSDEMEIIHDRKTYVKGYKYGEVVFNPKEIIHIRDNSAKSVYRGSSRLNSCKNTFSTLYSMSLYQDNFFNNSAIASIVLTTPNLMTEKVKERKIREWTSQYNPRKGGKRPMIIDGDMKVHSLGKDDLRELDFVESVKQQERKVLTALGVPPVLLDTGNNANLNPNIRSFYINTVLPLANKLVSALEFFFGYDLKLATEESLALMPDLTELGNFFTSIVNAGIITRNEARGKLRYEESDDEIADKLFLPANVAGSNQDPGTGGRPSQENNKYV